MIRCVREVQRVPYAWPSPPDAASARALGVGTCASKHAMLAEDLAAIGVVTLPLFVVGPLVPPIFRDDPSCIAGLPLREVHECLTALTEWAGPVRIDVTWDPPLVRRGFSGSLAWDGETDMALGVDTIDAGWAVPREALRAAKEALRARLYRPGERAVRDAMLSAISRKLIQLRVPS